MTESKAKALVKKYQRYYPDKPIERVEPSVGGYVSIFFENGSKLTHTPDPSVGSEDSED